MTGEVILRPSGKPYRPRRVRVHPWEDEYTLKIEETAGALVLGTHDVEAARALAAQACAYHFGTEYAVKPRLGWWRAGYAGQTGELSWVHDEQTGAAGVMFTASHDPEEA